MTCLSMVLLSFLRLRRVACPSFDFVGIAWSWFYAVSIVWLSVVFTLLVHLLPKWLIRTFLIEICPLSSLKILFIQNHWTNFAQSALVPFLNFWYHCECWCIWCWYCSTQCLCCCCAAGYIAFFSCRCCCHLSIVLQLLLMSLCLCCHKICCLLSLFSVVLF